MVKERRSRRRPPRLPDEPLDGPTTEEELEAVEDADEAAGGPIHQEMSRRGLQDVPEGNHYEEEYEEVSEGEYEEVSEEEYEDDRGEEEALVFDDDSNAGATVDTGETFVGELPIEDELAEDAPPVDKTEILQVSQGPEEEYPVLTVETADGSTSDVEVVSDRFVLGRAPDCEVVLPDTLVSRHHAVIEQRQDGWYLVDQNSGNGTFLNEERIHDELLYDGDVFQLGDAIVTFTAPGSEADQAPRLDSTRMFPASEAGPEGTSVTGAGTMSAASRKRKKLLLIAGIVVVLLAGAGIAKKLMTPPAPQGPTQAQLEAQRRDQAIAEAERKFERIKELAKQEKWIEALPMIREVAEVVPEAPIVKQYKASIEKEAAAAAAVEKARSLVDKNDFEGAVAALAGMPPDSTKIKAAEYLKKVIDETRLTHKLEQARSAMMDNRWDDAIAVADDVLRAFPDNEVAAEIKRAAEKEKSKVAVVTGHKRKKKRKRKRKVKPPPKPKYLLVGKALDLYRNEQVDLALSQSSSAGVNADGVKTLRRFQSFYKRGKELSRNPGQSAQAIKFLTKAVELDKKLSGGKGNLIANLKKKLAKAYFLQGVDAHTRKKFPLAYKSFTSALRYNPGLTQAGKRLKILEIESKKLFETAYVIKGSSPEKAVSHCQTVMGMVKKSNIYYAKCKKLIAQVRGPLGSSGDDGEGGF